MKSWKRLLFYLVLNVIVSACTVLAVLFAWDQLSGPIPRDLLPKALQSFALQSTPIPTSQPAEIPAVQAVPTEEFLVYQVKEGDTFESVAEEFGSSVEELIAVNGFTKSQPLGPGEVLRIPIHPAAGVIIESVIGAGDLDSECVRLKQQGAAEISLVGWRMEDEQENIFIFPQFPQLILYPRGAVNVCTKAGSNNVIEIYWGLNQPVWGSGENVTLKDPQGNVRATYKVP